MYKVTLTDIDKKVVKKINSKNLKSKNGHSLYYADQIMKLIHKNIEGSTKLTIIVSDLENELDYGFEDIAINSNLAEPNIIELLTEDILSSDHDDEDSRKLINNLEKQFQLEALKEREDTPNTNSRSNKPSKKGFNLFGKSKKQETVQNEPATLEDEDDFDLVNNEDDLSLVETQSTSNDFEDLSYDFNEIKEGSFVEQEELESTSYMTAAAYEENQNEEDFFPLDVPETIKEDYPVSKEEDPENWVIEDDYSHEIPTETVTKESTKKNEQIIFPEYNHYLDLSTVIPTIERNKERLEKENLIKFLGLNTLSNEETMPELDQIIHGFAFKSLDDSNFVLLRDYFSSAIEEVKNKTKTVLAHTYEKALSLDYEAAALQDIDEEVNKIYEESTTNFNSYAEKQDEEYNHKLSKFEFEQEKALEEFLKEQKREKDIFVRDLDNKKSGLIELFKDNLQVEINSKKEKLLDQRLYELKYDSTNQLAEGKRQQLIDLEDEVTEIVDSTWKKLRAEIFDLKKEIEKRIPQWKEEIEQKRRLDSLTKEEKIRQEELKLEKERLEIARKNLELEMNGNKNRNNESQPEMEIMSLIEERFSNMMDEKINTSLQSIIQTPQNEKVDMKETKKKKSLIPLVGGSLILLTAGGMFAGQLLGDENTPKVAEAKQVSDYDRLAEQLNTLESKLSNDPSTTTQANDSLDTLLREKKYEEAMRIYKDKDSLEKIEQELYINKDLATLTIFNKTFEGETKFGAIDEAILSKNVGKTKEIYKAMQKDVKDNLSKQQKADMALLFYQNDNEELGNEILGVKKDKNKK